MMQRSAKLALVGVVVVLVVGGLGFWWFVLRGDAPDRPALPVRTTDTTSAGSSDSGTAGSGSSDSGSTGVEATSADLEGDWIIRSGDDVFVGYRVQELFGGETVKKTAVGRTTSVTGSMTIAGGKVTAIDVTADVTKLESDEERRDKNIRRNGLQTDEFPEATFTLTEPIELPSPVVSGEKISVVAKGKLTLHGQTRDVEIPLEASWSGELIDVVGTAPVVFSDYGIEAPSNPMITVDDNGELELQLVLERG